jgi:hypothetical protein
MDPSLSTKPFEPSIGEDGLIKTLHHPDGIEQDDLFFDENKVSQLILDWKQHKDEVVWKSIVEATLPLIDTLILDGGFVDYGELDELRSECVIKLSRVIEKFDPNRGRAFTILSISIKHFLISYIQKIKSKTKLIASVEEDYLENVGGESYVSSEISEEFKKRVWSIETRFHDARSIEALKYYVSYFVSDGFATSKTKMCSTASQSFGITQEQSYILYDYALIQIRSVLVDIAEMPITDLELLRINKKWSVIPELASIIGMNNLNKIIHIFGGISITLPSPKDLSKLRKDRILIEKTNNEDSGYYRLKEISDKENIDAVSESERIFASIAREDCYTTPLFEESSEENL